jgi:hypothetical protein
MKLELFWFFYWLAVIGFFVLIYLIVNRDKR